MAQDSLTTIATRHQSHYERLKSSEVGKFDAFLVEMDKDLRAKLSGKDLTAYSRVRIEKLIKQIGAAMNGTYADYKKVWADSIKDASLYEAGFESRSLSQVVEGVEFSMPSDSQITAAVLNTPLGDIGGASGGSLLGDYFEDATKATVKRVEGAIRLGYAEGETTESIIRRVRGTKAANFKDGIWAATKNDIETVVRTSLQHASSQARGEVWKKNESVIEGVIISATLDKKTTSICRSLDGQFYPLDKGPRPPFHRRCRTTTTAKLKKKYADLSKGRTRSTRDPETGKVGKTSADTTYYTWLKRQPASVQNSIIGPTRGKLLRNGGMSTERFAELQLGKFLEPLTLDQMRKIEPIAFTKAGL